VLSAADPGNFVAFVDTRSDTVRYGYVVAAGLEIQPAPVGGVNVDTTVQEGVEILPLDFDQTPDNTSDETLGDGNNRIADRMSEDFMPVTVPASVVIATVSLNGDDKHAEVAAPNNVMNPKSLVDYYGKLYKKQGPEFYKRLVEIIENHASF
jgi:hypothetical protein